MSALTPFSPGFFHAVVTFHRRLPHWGGRLVEDGQERVRDHLHALAQLGGLDLAHIARPEEDVVGGHKLSELRRHQGAPAAAARAPDGRPAVQAQSAERAASGRARAYRQKAAVSPWSSQWRYTISRRPVRWASWAAWAYEPWKKSACVRP